MVVLTSVTAAVYAALMIPFKGLVLIPGITEIRPAAFVPVVFGILFGPAGAWGSGIGNLSGDFLGGMGGPLSLAGFLGNFFFAASASKFWENIHQKNELDVPIGENIPKESRLRFLIFYGLAAILAVSSVAFIIAWFFELLKLQPFSVLGSIIFFNNLPFTLVLGPFVLSVLFPLVRSWDIYWKFVMDRSDISRSRFPWLGIVFIYVGALGGVIAGFGLSTGLYGSGLFTGTSETAGAGVSLGLLPFLIIFLVGYFI